MNGKFPAPSGNARGSVLHSGGLLCSLLGMWDWIVIKDALRAVVEIFILWVFLYQIPRNARRAHYGGAVRLLSGPGGAGLFFSAECYFMDTDAHFRPRSGVGFGGDFPAGAARGVGKAGKPPVFLFLRQASAGRFPG